MEKCEIVNTYRAFAEKLGKKYNIQFYFDVTNKLTCMAGQDKKGKNIMTISPDRLVLDYAIGFDEYKSVRHVWPIWFKTGKLVQHKGSWYHGFNMIGLKAIWAVCLHEFAHVISGNAAGHNRAYQHNLSKLIRENPYTENFWQSPKADWEIFLGL